ncbi:glycoside hydrolase family 2 TIM barrel-domain containing protein [Maribacter luteus]|uniref:Beta-galactosidase n=1 Tax=Maribacter luteus TaxID=2594478 RepID=A0A6I2MRM2_9FLAO|nr:glycoside hydrolase family 2 TIM barrel-domain containing protein [Maribacter luteus]MRX66288.1 DUF4981 domain-containing protein [Maribacter luteus]
MNKTISISIFLLFVVPAMVISQEVLFSPNDWQDPSIFEKGQTAPHAFHVSFDTESAALKNDPSESKNYHLLNGEWDFKWVATVDKVPEGFWLPSFNTIEWDKIKVPSNWQMEGYGHAKFRNISLSFESDPPHIPSYYNPVGCYRKPFDIPETWEGKNIKLRFEGVKSASYIWINGKRVGYNQGGFEPAEFDISSFVTTGKNILAVQVIRFSDGSYLENQDMWRLSGIFRDVKLYAQPKTMIRDHYVVTDLDGAYENATLSLSTITGNLEDTAKKIQLEIDVFDDNNNSILGRKAKSGLLNVHPNASEKIDITVQVQHPKKWSAEMPNRYTLLVNLKDNDGNLLESFSEKIGFREVEYTNNVLTVNGIPIKLNGINSHMHHPEKGQAVPIATLRKDLEIMKRFNLNCVRTCHYPPTPEYLDLADELGIYVVDEVGDEAHANIQQSENPKWTEMYKDRSRKLVYRDRNHPSVIIWSAGNESGSGENIKAVIETGKEIDPSRPAWMYGGNTFYIPFEDIVGPRYYIPLGLRHVVKGDMLPKDDDRSSFMDEYLAPTGNSLGGLDEYWKVIRRSPKSMGGAIWDFVSPGINTPRWTLPDKSPKKNDGQIMGRPSFVEGKHGRGLQFSGHDDWVEFYRDPSLDITGKALAIGFWVKPSKIPQTNVFLSKGIEQYGIQMRDSETLEFYVNSKNATNYLINDRVSAKVKVGPDFYDKWHHIAGIYDGQYLKLYVDEKVVSQTQFSRNISTTAFPLGIGREAEKQDQGEYSGRMSSMIIDDVRIFDHPVSLLQLQNNIQDAVLALDFDTDTKGEDFYAVGLGGRSYGVIWPDRTVQPEIHQIKKSGQPISLELIDALTYKVKITNYHHFKNLNQLNGYWSLLEDGKEIENGSLSLDLAAQKSSEINIPCKTKSGQGELILTIGFTLKENESWANNSHEVAWEQFILKKANTPEPVISVSEKIKINESSTEIEIYNKDFTYIFNKENGKWTSFLFKGSEYLENGPDFKVWRAPLANDVDPWGAYKYPSKNMTPGYGRSIDNQLRTLGLRDLHNLVDSIDITKSPKEVRVKVKIWSASSLDPYTSIKQSNDVSAFERDETWTIYPDGTLELDQEITPHGPMPDILPKEGLQFQLPKSFNQVSWYGRGPFETYPDRKTGAKFGVYDSNANEMYVPYILPQDYGNRTDVRWLKVSDEKGNGLLISGDLPLNFSLHKYDTDNLSRAVYTYQLKESSNIILNIDHKVSGVGGTAIRQLQTYREKATSGHYKLKIKPFTK